MAERRERAARFLPEAVVQGRDVAGELATLVRSALAPSTRRTYTAAERLFRGVIFGDHTGRVEIYPLTGEMILTFLYVMDKVGYPYSTIRTYVAGLRTQNVEQGYALSHIESEHIRRALTAIRRKQPPGTDRSGAKATVSIVQARGAVVADFESQGKHTAEAVALRLCLFGLLRCRECLAMRCCDIFFEVVDGCDVVRLKVRRSKTDQFAAGVAMRIGCAVGSARRPCEDPLCPVHALYTYMCSGFTQGALAKDGMVFGALSYNGFLGTVKQLFGSQAEGNYGTHSLRRSGSQWLWLAGVTNFEIAQYGRWSLLDTLQHRYLNGVAKVHEHRYAQAMVTGRYYRM
ncbi:hypothetical protein FOZ60_007723 [Perkinsus olseni]|uniref:Integrase n=1 Tax=Perkinsus olseni TaxID=32597 RepID=A0A7J6NKV3_PEROL|nr:hypothetical protein FOZ60_007723 [Perkinsus olseni]